AMIKAGAASYVDRGNITHLHLEARQEWYDATSRSLDVSALEATRQTFSTALANELLLFSNALSIIGSIRGELIEDENFRATPILPAAGLIWRAAPTLHFKANAARTFRAPDFDELYLDTESVRGNPNLDPERAWTFDAGLQAGDPELTRKPWSAGVTVFENHIEEMILFLPTSAYLFEAMNLSDALSRGLELTAALRPFRRLQLHGGYTLTRAHLKSDGATSSRLPHQPLHRGQLRLSTDLSELAIWRTLHHVGLHTSASYRSRIHLDHFQNLRNQPALFLDAGANVAITPRISLDLNVYNLLDHRRAEDTLQRPLPGRALFVGLTIRSPQ
ncbi:MAG: TonB-dependent receptor, partial [Bradymonadaceae bacterium]